LGEEGGEKENTKTDDGGCSVDRRALENVLRERQRAVHYIVSALLRATAFAFVPLKTVTACRADRKVKSSYSLS